MSPRVLVIEPDPAGRALMERALATGGFAPEAAASIHDARACLDAGTLEIAVVDELAGGLGLLDEVRWLRARYPSLPVIVTGTRLAPRTLEELLRLGAAEALRKPFTPAELREAAARAVTRAGALHAEALEYAAALGIARAELAAGRTAAAATALGRAQAASPLDAEAMALRALLAELEGRDADADRGYRAAIALRQDEDAAPPDPFEGSRASPRTAARDRPRASRITANRRGSGSSPIRCASSARGRRGRRAGDRAPLARARDGRAGRALLSRWTGRARLRLDGRLDARGGCGRGQRAHRRGAAPRGRGDAGADRSRRDRGAAMKRRDPRAPRRRSISPTRCARR